jgi:hypothetical protein
MRPTMKVQHLHARKAPWKQNVVSVRVRGKGKSRQCKMAEAIAEILLSIKEQLR